MEGFVRSDKGKSRKPDLPVVIEESESALDQDMEKTEPTCQCHPFTTTTDIETCACCSCPEGKCKCDEESVLSYKSDKVYYPYYSFSDSEEECPPNDQDHKEKESPYCKCKTFKTDAEKCECCSCPIENCMCDELDMKIFEQPDTPPEGLKSVRTEVSCPCSEDTSSLSTVVVDCKCPRDDKDIVIHVETCFLYKNETMMYEGEPNYCSCPPYETTTEICMCCSCPVTQCICDKPGKETFEEYRERRDLGPLPAVLESTHPLMKKFQDSLRRFLEKENELAQADLITLRDDLKLKREVYDADLEALYLNDHDTDAQRILIKEYEDALENETRARLDAQELARIKNEEYSRCKQQFDQDLRFERDSALELDSLSALVQQMEEWRKETESEFVQTKRTTEKMRLERQVLAEKKRQMDMYLYTINNEIWKFQSNMELYKKQIEIKNAELNKFTDKVITYSTELEDLELDKKRLRSLWNSVVANIKHRDNVYDLVRNDYMNLQTNYHVLETTLEFAKKQLNEEIEKHKCLYNDRDKLEHDCSKMIKHYEGEMEIKNKLEEKIARRTEALHMTEGDYEMTKMERNTLQNILAATMKEYEKRSNFKVQLENQLLQNLANCLTNDKAVEAMCSKIWNMRDTCRKLEMSFAEVELKYSNMLVVTGTKIAQRMALQERCKKNLKEVEQKQNEYHDLEKECRKYKRLLMKKQRENGFMTEKYKAAKKAIQVKSPMQIHVEELEHAIKNYRSRTEGLQCQWLRLQGHVVRLTEEYHKTVTDIGLVEKQLQICDQKNMYNNAQIHIIRQERHKLHIVLRELGGRLQVLESAKKASRDQNNITKDAILALSNEYSAGLKDAESELVKLEEEIGMLDKEKENLSLELDHLQREAMAWQRKGILAVELKRSICDAKTSAGEIGQMKNEIHRMEVRREHLRRTADKLSEDLSWYVEKRESVLEKTRASAALEKARGTISNKTHQYVYKHKLRLAKDDVARVTKELADDRETVKNLQDKEKWLLQNINKTNALNIELQERVAQLLKEIQVAKRNKQWVLERVVRRQRLAAELQTACKRQSLRMKRSKETVVADFEKSRILNSKLRHINNVLMHEYSYLEDKLLVISNTLNIKSPSNSPRPSTPCE